jgi:hypothetical protein
MKKPPSRHLCTGLKGNPTLAKVYLSQAVNKRPGQVTVTTEVAYCSFCARPRTIRREERQLGALVRTTVTCETCHRTLASTIGVAGAEPAPEPPATEPTPEPAEAPPVTKKPPAKAAAKAKTAAAKTASKPKGATTKRAATKK